MSDFGKWQGYFGKEALKNVGGLGVFIHIYKKGKMNFSQKEALLGH